VVKVGWDSVPAVRAAVIRTLAEASGPLTMAHIQELTGLPQKTTQRVVEDVVALKLATRTKVDNKWYVQQSEEARDYWTSAVGPTARASGSWPEASEGVPNALARGVGGGAALTEEELAVVARHPEFFPPETPIAHIREVVPSILAAEARTNGKEV
jgi:hypothetical protein